MSKFHVLVSYLTVFCLLNLRSIVGSESVDKVFVVEGIVDLKSLNIKATNAKLLLNGGELIAFPRANGYFAFHGVRSGTHFLEVFAPGATFPPIRLDVSARLNGEVTATYAENLREKLPEPLVITPIKVDSYFEKRDQVSVLAFVKTPTGILVLAGLFVMFVLPKLMEMIDPEEMEKFQEELKGKQGPSLAVVLQKGK